MTKGNKDLCPFNHKSYFKKYDKDFPKPNYIHNGAEGEWTKCYNIKYIESSCMDSELYECKVCGLRYRLYYDDMR